MARGFSLRGREDEAAFKYGLRQIFRTGRKAQVTNVNTPPFMTKDVARPWVSFNKAASPLRDLRQCLQEIIRLIVITMQIYIPYLNSCGLPELVPKAERVGLVPFPAQDLAQDLFMYMTCTAFATFPCFGTSINQAGHPYKTKGG